MTPALNIVNKLLETDDTSPGVLAYYVDQAGRVGLFVPDPLPADKSKWWVLTMPLSVGVNFKDKPCSQIAGSTWRLHKIADNKEEAKIAAEEFLAQHGKTP